MLKLHQIEVLLPHTIRILNGGRLVASHTIREGRRQCRIDPDHRQGMASRAMRRGHPDGPPIGRHGDHVARRSLAVYQAIGERLAGGIGGQR
ncbi:hypothetical protein HNR51_005351 [Methylorubrum thiocyanatum]|uniref:Uncharacterized protein n=1 Tax=Methylorubrum thiocyanatum TaxID=47958 RepID=A0AA40VEM5_9HYPH|nr:hypothetical protein [Methylorubrum thiocyanatum]GJE83795.1 hypothetical protein CJNNKLLH_5173 [Methylorubrum thiocyanatum]